MIPTWGELGKRIGWLCFGWYRQQRKAWRRWRISRRPAKPVMPKETPTVLLPTIPDYSGVCAGMLGGLGNNLGVLGTQDANAYSALLGAAQHSTHYGAGLKNSGYARQWLGAEWQAQQKALAAQQQNVVRFGGNGVYWNLDTMKPASHGEDDFIERIKESMKLD